MSDEDPTTAVGALVAVLSVLAVGLRFYTRYSTEAGFKWDDWLILLALLAMISTDILSLYGTSINPQGAERASNSDPNQVYTSADILYGRIGFGETVLYYTVTSSTKLSILLMYNRLFSVNPSFRHQVIGAAILVVGFWIGCTVADLLNCIPLKWVWLNSQADPRYCFNYNIFWMASGIVELILDVLIIAMPIKIVIGLQLNKRKKVAVAAVFFLGFFAVLSGLVKVIVSYVPGSRNPEFSKTIVWTTVHAGTGIVCACLPVCWPLFVRLTRLSLSPWPVVSSIQKHWYSFSGWSSMDRRSASRGATPEFERSTNAIAGGYELPIYNAGAKT
ncbi:hypothetical protein F5B20DRAFT_248573 [Whalleya microplaca]|nr:hypothetical protein F5B20DRAFT_248573 [Whalleya microplaca]